MSKAQLTIANLGSKYQQMLRHLSVGVIVCVNIDTSGPSNEGNREKMG